MPGPEKLRLGSFEIVRLCDGRFLVAGAGMFKGVPRDIWASKVEPDAAGRVAISLNCFLVSGAGLRILVDTGVGPDPELCYARSYSLERDSGLFEGLASLGLSAGDVDIVFHTHLHFDHCGADTRPAVSSAGGREPAFPRARYIVREGEWRQAFDRKGPDRTSYLPGRLACLEGSEALVKIDRDMEIAEGIEAVLLPGHTADHQGLKIVSGGRTMVICGDAVTSAAHLEIGSETGFDLHPVQSRGTCARLCEQAAAGDWLLAFGHDAERPWGRVRRDGGGFVYRPV